MKATESQLLFIKQIEEFVEEKFKGLTKEDAHLYIQRNKEEFQLRSASTWAMENGYI